ncbi:MAG TPA: hypothetical protein DCS55_16680 [Acidimicrobiaceae bacterium]|nr:hypothetical protein [Acidimicrobiaceae bacterium]
MRPLTAASAGLVLLLVDFRVYGIDIAVDPAGWVLIAWGLWRLAGTKAAAPAVAGAAFSAAEAYLPYHYALVESYVAGPNGTASVEEVEVLEYDQVAGLPLISMALAAVCSAVAIVVLVRLLRERAGPDEADPALRTMYLSMIATLALWIAPRLVGMIAGGIGDGYDPVWNDPVWRIELAGIVSGLVLASSLLASRREPWALPPGPRRESSWAPAGRGE